MEQQSVVRETMEGQIGHEIVGANGFGYDPIFYVPEYRMYNSGDDTGAEK